MNSQSAFVLGGVPAINMNVRHRIQFSVGDAVFYICLPQPDGGFHSILLVRDIEMGLARKNARADEIGCAADYEPECGLAGDRDTALAQAGADVHAQWGRRGAHRALGNPRKQSPTAAVW